MMLVNGFKAWRRRRWHADQTLKNVLAGGSRKGTIVRLHAKMIFEPDKGNRGKERGDERVAHLVPSLVNDLWTVVAQ